MAQLGFAPAADVAFGIVFGLFVFAFLVLAFIAIRWGIRRDRTGRQAWRQRHLDESARATQTSANGSATTRPRDDDRP
jgi:hypothetical protein